MTYVYMCIILALTGARSLFASRCSCGIDAWTTNSHVVHATSKHAGGPYVRQEEVWPRFAHEPNVVRAPTGEWVMTFVAWPVGTKPSAACNCTDGNTLPSFHCKVCRRRLLFSRTLCGLQSALNILPFDGDRVAPPVRVSPPTSRGRRILLGRGPSQCSSSRTLALARLRWIRTWRL